ncbi:Formyl-CoA:oxalate CoA-transferase [Paraburkholderia aspalathi]|uniref:Formyl-CoA:oxalate CoA-transferase n=1 Tax=Paraburkholderia aspalathi TaxID=1324617 RepID=A0ABM8QK40_9BURK|nr:CoA transferase [Paraburkholderia aspalathi]MBK3817182.1 CoA transferase [Paraburkholderia aspalathi]MBK3829034.1 CoA transferase [Paraburkholderia aspalathi]MBK3858719.1 CoA transferase [Paraburkholderia aspalathi]CAE6701524.1 Formyl-CoA:oxalate CoA-transferase [Paraburkholderia aspalathi]
MSTTTPELALKHIWMTAQCDPTALHSVSLPGADPGLPSVYRVGALAQATIAASGLAAAEYHRLRTGRRQHVTVEMRRALASFRSERYLRIDDGPPPALRDPVMGFYATRDCRWIQLHTNFPHHLEGVLKVLGCANDRAAVAEAIRGWDGATLDQTLADAGLCAALIRTPDEWAALDQAKAISGLPLFEIERIGDAPVEPPREAGAERPLAGVRVLDLSRIIAGPVAGRALAQHGAEVLMVNGPHLPNIAPLVIDNGRGKRSAVIDLRDATGQETLNGLVSDADVFLQAYRPGALTARGFGPEELARVRPGIVYVSVCAYGHTGPWAGRRGFDSLVQSASGIAFTEREAAGWDEPKHLPCQALDHATGYLAAFGAMAALARRATEGGSWHVRVSLAQTGRWLQSFGLLPDGWKAPDVSIDDVRDCLGSVQSEFGRVLGVLPAERLEETPARFDLPPARIGAHEAKWA